MAKRRARNLVPTFSSEAEERRFWETHDTSPFVDWTKARVAVFPNLKPSTETISWRLPAALLAELKALANKRDVPYQSLLRCIWPNGSLTKRTAETYCLRGSHGALALPGQRDALARPAAEEAQLLSSRS